MTPRLRPLLLLLAAGVFACFTGDELVDQPCERDADCNPHADLLGEQLACSHGICGYTQVCGDAIVDGEEQCDDGNRVNDDGCTNDCKLPDCGDGIVQAPEQCDDRNEVDDDHCRNNCKIAACGDGVVWAQGEQCDDGNADDSDECVACKHAECGDGVVQAGKEECDDRNHVDDDGCSNNCKGAFCGDGKVQEGVEQCDDGNQIDTDLCPTTCQNRRCGDGFVYEPDGEQCDDGNADNNDFCVACKFARCGDGYVHTGMEECDSLVNCAGCELSVCGDGDQNHLTEPCEDNNDERNDGCDECRMGAVGLSRGSVAAHSCAVRDGHVTCWGNNGHARLGYGNSANLGDEPSDLPLASQHKHGLTDIEKAPQKVLLGGEHSCAIVGSMPGELYCWGHNASGQAGQPFGFTDSENIRKQPLPVNIPGLVDEVVAGRSHTCARSGSSVYCWGDNEYGQLGTDLFDAFSDPFPVALAADADQLAAGEHHTCARLVDDTVQCWGRNLEAQYDDDLANEAIKQVAEFAGAKHVTAGVFHTCALFADDPIHCRGAQVNPYNQERACDPFCDEDFVTIEAGGHHTCGLYAESKLVACWGGGYYGQTGAPNINSPTLNEFDEIVREIHTGFDHTCVLLDGGRVRCFGQGSSGQLGNGSTATIPVEAPLCAAAVYDADDIFDCPP